MKRFIFLAVLIFAAFNTIVSANNIEITAAGDSEITVKLSTDFGFSAGSFEFIYDNSCMEFVSNIFSENLSGAMSMVNPAYRENSVKFSVISIEGVPAGEICEMKFSKKANADKNILLTLKNATFADGQENKISFEVVEKELIFENPKKNGSSSGRGGGGSGKSGGSVIAGSITSPGITEKIILTIGKKEATVFGEVKVNDVAPVIRNNRTMLPARFVAENLGAAVYWMEETRTVRISKAETEILIAIDSPDAVVNGVKVTLDSPAFIENNRTYTPLRFIAENLGAEVDWNEVTREVTISKGLLR